MIAYKALADAVSRLALAASSPPTDMQICKVLEAAYTTAAESGLPAYPARLQPSWRSLDLPGFVPEYRQRLGLALGEFEDLMQNAWAGKSVGYRPLCATVARPSEFRDPDGHLMSISFTRPIFSTSGALAIVEVSFQEPGFGYGSICIVRRRQVGWSATCHASWIT